MRDKLKLSNKGRYGVRAIFDIAFHGRGKATQVKHIAERQEIPVRFLEQIFQELKKSGLVSSKRGPRGGYALSRASAEISVGDVIRALEGKIRLDDASHGGDATGRAVTSRAFRDLEADMEACLDALSIEDLCERGEAEGLHRKPPHRYVYSI
ncbi:MAG: Rrf2 family transcriptional regulator [Deltaproteobacteria bacterium]|nr:Rrf2 family transcriptional regulator [Deltaproteobacteria bacterium]